MCAVHALNNLFQGGLGGFSVADLREGAELAQMADIEADAAQAEGNVVPHQTPSGNFSIMAVGRALSARFCDWRPVELRLSAAGVPDPEATVLAAFGPVDTDVGPRVVCGIFVHQGAHYTAIIQRGGALYHIDSLPGVSGHGHFAHTLTAEQFVAHVAHYRTSPVGPEGVRAGGLWRVFNRGAALALG